MQICCGRGAVVVDMRQGEFAGLAPRLDALDDRVPEAVRHGAELEVAANRGERRGVAREIVRGFTETAAPRGGMTDTGGGSDAPFGHVARHGDRREGSSVRRAKYPVDARAQTPEAAVQKLRAALAAAIWTRAHGGLVID